MRKIALALLLLIMAATTALADTVYLRDGRSIRGSVLGYIAGRFAVRVDQQTQITTGNNQTQTIQPGEIAYLRPRDIERVEIDGRNLDEARFMTRSVEVSLGPNWIDTGVDVRRNQRIQITATGTIYAGRTRISPSGLRSTDPGAPLPRAAEGVLIATIGTDPNAPITEIGTNREFQADRDGRLYLTVNRGEYSDARGSFNAQVRREIELGGGRGSTGRRSNNTDDDDFDPFGSGGSSNEGAAPVRRRTTGGRNEGSTNYPSNAQERTVVVPGNSRGTDTGIDLRRGDSVSITATGNITAGRRAGVVSADGGRVGVGSIVGTYPVAQAGVGALIGYIRMANGQTTQPFLVGTQQTFEAPMDGRLYLLVNDDNYGDNSGQFDVRVSVQ
ncbi:MAG TPA: LecA/PA-IL family lectin [Pyrinomonadaceae bacterium]|nr:LecA/PA-IL family lectin [Pyrinomonadaceae bacterium]